MMNRILFAAVFACTSAALDAQGTTPTPPSPAKAPQLVPPVMPPPPTRPLTAAARAQRTPTPATLKAPAPGGAPLSSARSDSTRQLAVAKPVPPGPAARVSNPPHRGPKPVDSTTIVTQVRPAKTHIAPSQRVAPPPPLPQPQKKP